MLSQQLRNIANQARGVADQQQAAGQSQIGLQTQQAIAAQPAGTRPTKRSAQELAAAITQSQQQLNMQTQQMGDQAVLGAAQQAVQGRQFGQQQALQEQQSLTATEIAKLQRQGALRQNSEQLKQAKRLQKNELDMQKRIQSASIEYDNRLSFLTRKQREDLSALDSYTKQQIFDNRLSFRYTEGQRKFSNMRQLADYTVASALDNRDLQNRMREMNQAAAKEIMILEHVHNMLTERLKLEFRRSEGQKDNTTKIKIYEMKQAMERKIARKKKNASANASIITGVAMAAGAVLIATGVGGPAGAVLIASAPALGAAGAQAME